MATLIEAIEGSKAIGRVEIGELVATRDAFSGEKVYRPVTNLFSRVAPSITHLTLDGPSGRREQLDVTSEHPLFVEGRGWLEVRRLVIGDRIVSSSQGALVVTEIVTDAAPTRVYNFEVAQDHSYFAGEEGAWSHNAFTGGTFWGSLKKNIRGYKGRRDADGCGYDPDFTHDELEKYNKHDDHLGPVSPETGDPIPGKGPVPGRRPPWRKK